MGVKLFSGIFSMTLGAVVLSLFALAQNAVQITAQ
jgi:hypothetical protein